MIFFRLNVIRRVLEIFDHFGGLLNHSTLSGTCQIVFFFNHNFVANQFLFNRDLLNLLNWRILMKIERFKKYFCMVLHLNLLTEKKLGKKIKRYSNKSPPSTYYQLFSL